VLVVLAGAGRAAEGVSSRTWWAFFRPQANTARGQGSPSRSSCVSQLAALLILVDREHPTPGT
jgi:hypothetical protein